MAKTTEQIDALVADVLSAPAHIAQGLSAVAVGGGEATLEFVAGPASLAPTGAVHGGILTMLMDPAALCALLPMLPDGAHAVTADMYVQHMRPARPGARLQIVARVLRMGRSLAFCEADVMDGETRCSTARITKAVVAAK
ncbi:MAG TPA: PaaI family thioesterase [Beijerinckiaceae bacterium]|nr:PaaI family thioesterase [Rhodoblastus sp.]MCC0001229.1 PaaI family thioesterase [Methylobacteriaceae bacterium]MCO5088390.1 PaaI family thioesterase [Methylobacteriaceae bacterium]HRY05107.1 PaaI family thioesterase [Beijerinckiaceae bacterium]